MHEAPRYVHARDPTSAPASKHPTIGPGDEEHEVKGLEFPKANAMTNKHLLAVRCPFRASRG